MCMRQTVQEVAAALVANIDLQTFKADALLAPVVAWMEDNGIIEESGHISPSLVTLQTKISKPRQCSACDSRVSLSNRLEGAGWVRRTSIREASVADRCYNGNGPLEYHLLLWKHYDDMQGYDQAFPCSFKHSQSKAYYTSLLTFFQEKRKDTWSTKRHYHTFQWSQAQVTRNAMLPDSFVSPLQQAGLELSLPRNAKQENTRWFLPGRNWNSTRL